MSGVNSTVFLKHFLDNDEEPEDAECVEEGEWVSEHKYQMRDDVWKWKDKFFMISQSRSGSYHTDYYYDDPECCEVKPVEVVIKKINWVAIKEAKPTAIPMPPPTKE